MPSPEADPTFTHPAAPTDPPPGSGTVLDQRATPGSSGTVGGSGDPPAVPVAPPAVVPGFEIEAELGRGGMGVVYKARQAELNRTVALKMVLAGGQADPVSRARFLLEAEAVAALDHPAVVRVYGFGRNDDLPYLAMEFVGGGTLADRVRRDGPSAPVAAAGLVARLADGVAAAHARGIVHRDLKPSNVLLTEEGEPKIADFGLAKVGQSDITSSGAVMGTPSYMSPEQASGHARDVGTPADVWALGAILYELLTGGPPFRGTSPAHTIYLVIHAEPARPRAVAADVPRDLEAVCLRCLEKGPRRRYPTAAALADDLRAFLDGRPTAARPVGPVERAVRWVRRNKALAGVAAAVVVAAGAAVYAAVVSDTARVARETADRESSLRAEAEGQRERAEQERATARQAEHRADHLRQQAELLRGRAEDAEARTRRVMYGVRMGAAERAMREGNDTRLDAELTATVPRAGEEGPRGFEWFHLRQFVRRPVAVLRGHEDRVTAVAYGPGGAWLASAGLDGFVLVSRPGAEKPDRSLTVGAGAVTSVAVSPDGKLLAAGGFEQKVLVWDTATWETVQTLPCPVGPAGALTVVFSPDGKKLAAGGGRLGRVRVWEVAGWKAVETLTMPTPFGGGLAFDPEGKRLALGGATSVRSEVWGLAEKKSVATLGAGHDAPVRAVAFSPDGERLATASTDQTVRLWDATTGEPGPVLRGHAGPVLAVRFSPDGNFLASASQDGTVRLWDGATGAALAMLKADGAGTVAGLSFSPDGRRLAAACGDGAVRVWPVVGGQDVLTLRAGEPLHGLATDPAGRLVVAFGADGVAVWDPATGKRRHSLPTRARVGGVAVSPDGKRVAVAEKNGWLQVFDAETGKALRTIEDAHPGGAECVAFAPDGNQLVSGGRDELVKVWGAAGVEPARTLRGHTNAVRAVAFAPDGLSVAAGGEDKTVNVWGRGGDRPAFSGRHDDAVVAVAFARGGRELVTASWDETAAVWDLAAGGRRTALRGHAGWVHAAVFAPDGRRVATAGADGVIRIWDAATGQELVSLRGHAEGAPARGLAFRADGRRLFSAAEDRTIKAWDAPE